MKSSTVSVMWPTWMWSPYGRPGERWVFASYAQELATRDSTKRRYLMESPWYRERWGSQVAFAKDQNEKTRYQNTRRGEMFATSMSGTGTGFGGNWIVVDDPHNTRQVVSRVERESQVDFFTQTLSRRLDDKRKGVIVIVMQRLGVDDLSGVLLGMGGWEHLKLPGEAHGDERIYFPVSKRYHERKAGDLLWAAREGAKEIKEAKDMLGSRGYAGQYDQEPVPLGGAVFHGEWWRYYRDLPGEFERIVISLDSAHKTKKENDHSVFTVWGIKGTKVYLLWIWRGKVEFPDLKRVAAALLIRWRPSAMLVEDASSGSSLIQEFKEPIRIDDRIKTLLMEFGHQSIATLAREVVSPPILAISPDKDKLARAEAVTPMVERGDVELPDPTEYDVPWLAPYLNEFAKFTGLNDPEDDQVDSTTQFLNYVRGLGSFNVLDFWRKSARDADQARYRNGACWVCNKPILDNQPYFREGDRKRHANGCPIPIPPSA